MTSTLYSTNLVKSAIVVLIFPNTIVEITNDCDSTEDQIEFLAVLESYSS